MEKLLDSNYYSISTVISKTEMFFGAYKKNWGHKKLQILKNLFESLVILNFTAEAAEKYGKIRANLVLTGKNIGFADTAIGSIALVTGCSILTGNFNHFSRIPKLNILKFTIEGNKF